MEFQQPYTGEVLRFVKNTYGMEPEFLWAKSPGNAVFRRADNRKWYGALIKIQRERLGLEGEGTVEIWI